jgi:hypothetical protein
MATGASALSAASIGCSVGDENGADAELPPQPQGPVPPNTIPVRCPW